MYCLGKREYNKSPVINPFKCLSLGAQQIVVSDVALLCLCVYNSPSSGSAATLVLLF